MTSWAVYNENGPYTKANAIGNLAPAQFGGLSYSILAEKGNDIYVIQTESFGRCAIWAPVDNDSSISVSPIYANGNISGGGGGTTGTGKYLNLHAHMTSWGVYNVNGPYTSAYKIGSLAPAQFGGLSYSILEEKGNDVYIIQTDSFGRCAIWAPVDNDSSITTSPAYSNGNTSGGGIISGNGKYLNLHAHMSSWGVYNVNGPYTSAYKIGSLAPAQFGGLSYSILDEKGNDVYIIQTDSFGRCAIWAPRDNDSSITTSPTYANGNTSGGGGSTGGGGVIIPGGLKVFIDPGHGGYDPGAGGSGLSEKNVVLSISKKLGILLNQRGVSVQYSRTTDVDVSLEGRPQQANAWGANLFVSIHANASDTTARGTECYTTFTADSATKQLSSNVAKAIANKLSIPNRGHKEEIWRVLRLSNMPAILVETAFIDNSSDASLLNTRQDDFVLAIANEICSYLNVVTPPIPPSQLDLIKELTDLSTRYNYINSLTGFRNLNKNILDYLRHILYNDDDWIKVLGNLSPFVDYVLKNHNSFHNKMVKYINRSANININNIEIDLPHLAATILGYTNDLISNPPSIAIPNFWIGWGGDLATAMSDTTKYKLGEYKDYTEQYIADNLVIGKDSSCSKLDIEADIDAIWFAKKYTTERFDVVFEKYYFSVTSKVRKEVILNMEFNSPISISQKDFIFSIKSLMIGLQGFNYPKFGGKLKLKASYNGTEEPTNNVIDAICTSFAKYILNF
ncbi:MAG: N-acetylmuramoyl-L-alanine amidase family protein [Clostridium sp.]